MYLALDGLGTMVQRSALDNGEKHVRDSELGCIDVVRENHGGHTSLSSPVYL